MDCLHCHYKLEIDLIQYTMKILLCHNSALIGLVMHKY